MWYKPDCCLTGWLFLLLSRNPQYLMMFIYHQILATFLASRLSAISKRPSLALNFCLSRFARLFFWKFLVILWVHSDSSQVNENGFELHTLSHQIDMSLVARWADIWDIQGEGTCLATDGASFSKYTSAWETLHRCASQIWSHIISYHLEMVDHVQWFYFALSRQRWHKQ